MSVYAALAYSLGLISVSLFAVYAFVRSYFHKNVGGDTEEFLTARGQIKMWRVAWSFYAGSVGAWTLIAPPQYAVVAGVIGMVVYSISSGLPIFLVALFGHAVQSKYPHVLSLGDYAGQRFGKITQGYVVFLCTFNMVIALLAEYTTVGALVSDYLGLPAIPVIVIIGLLTMLYTVAGGLYVSIITDQIQGMASIILVAVLIFYISFTFREPLASPLPQQLGPSQVGYSSILAMPVSLFTSTVFSEAVWQRIWASENRRALNWGAAIGGTGVVLLVFFTSFCGFLAYWSGIITEDTNENLYFFSLVSGDRQQGQTRINSWAGVISMVLAVTMNESAVDSLQNGLVASIGGYFLKNRDINWVRGCVVLVNVPIVVLATFDFNVLQLFLLANMLCSTSAIPILLGLAGGKLQKYITDQSVLGACAFSIFSVSALGVIEKNAFGEGLYYTWIGNDYNWKYFLVATLSSAVFLFITGVTFHIIELFYYRKVRKFGFIKENLDSIQHISDQEVDLDVSNGGQKQILLTPRSQKERDAHKFI